ncbi:MAG: hypothetical protein HWQ41_17990 [Nostoc sp. NOS(2021)]|uniref:hypothetical protein n=1 Tax=Nostoc sp. NOS(2021) TaxID=2815407 RepID=UPI0025E4E5C9|nr:hypothetical protein [Nostoc sp. NOS(2021)]MBN3897092.1 hypothetical protein [Nostoc sp. NOS(2021)]
MDKAHLRRLTTQYCDAECHRGKPARSLILNKLNSSYDLDTIAPASENLGKLS